METKKILVINGPNLNMTGVREPDVYGSETLDDINASLRAYAKGLRLECEFFQSNCEGDIISKIHEVYDNFDGCVINAGAYTHYSYAIHDAIKCVDKPFVEVHLSNLSTREEFRHKSVLTPACVGIIAGFGKNSYMLALNALRELLND